MTGEFAQNLRRVSAAHAALLLALFLTSVWHGLFAKAPPLLLPVEFMIEMPGDPGETAVQPVPDARPPVPRPDVADVVKVPSAKPRPKPKPAPPKPKGVKKPSHNLTEEQIKQMLMQGAVIGDHTSIPDEDTRNQELIRRTLYAAWMEPSAAEVGRAAVEVEIELDLDGRIVGSRLVRSSGLPFMDDSVMQAVRTVTSIPGISSGFVSRYPKVNVVFELRR